MSAAVHVLRRSELGENQARAFELGGLRCVVADIDGEISAFSVSGPAAETIDRAAVADGRIRCAVHGWPIDPVDGRCGAAELCRYRPLAVDVEGDEIRVRL